MGAGRGPQGREGRSARRLPGPAARGGRRRAGSPGLPPFSFPPLLSFPVLLPCPRVAGRPRGAAAGSRAPRVASLCSPRLHAFPLAQHLLSAYLPPLPSPTSLFFPSFVCLVTAGPLIQCLGFGGGRDARRVRGHLFRVNHPPSPISFARGAQLGRAANGFRSLLGMRRLPGFRFLSPPLRNGRPVSSH